MYVDETPVSVGSLKNWLVGRLLQLPMMVNPLLHPVAIAITLTLQVLYLVGGFNPSENISQLGWLFPIYGKIKHVPNHQPDIYHANNPMFVAPNVIKYRCLTLKKKCCVIPDSFLIVTPPYGHVKNLSLAKKTISCSKNMH